MKVTENTSLCVFNHWNPATVLSDITGNAPGRVAIGNVNQEASWTDYSATSTITGWGSFTSKEIYTKKIGDKVFVQFRIVGTSNATSASFTLPYQANSNPLYSEISVTYSDNGSTLALGRGYLQGGTSTLNVGISFTNSGTKQISGQFFYEA